MGNGTGIPWDLCPGTKFLISGTVPWTQVLSSPKNFGRPKVVTWDTNPLDSWDWN